MPFTLLQVGNSLKSVNATGALSDALSLPSGITLASNRVPRFARFKGYVVVVNTPSRPLLVSDAGLVFPLTPNKPGTAVALTGPNAGSLSGTYLALQTYVIKDALGNIITESDFGPDMSAAVAITSKKLLATYEASNETGIGALGTRLYRTATLGSTYFPWVDNMANTTTSESDLADAELSSVEADERGTAPDLTLIAEYAGRLWGVDRDNIDDLRYTQAGTAYGWSALNTLRIPHYGDDEAGIVALIPRRNALGAARRGVFTAVTGSQRTNFKPTVVNGGENQGVESQESVIVWRDVAYFLAQDGVYKWDDSGIGSISDQRVRGWFTTDDYFNRSMFWRAFAQFDPLRLKYRLFLAGAGSETINRWVEYDLITGAWFGPHLTSAFDPSCAVLVAGTDQKPHFMIGSLQGHLSQESDSTKNDWGTHAIALSAKTREHQGGDPERETYFGELTVHCKPVSGGALSVTPYTGDAGATSATAAFTASLTYGRARLGRIGVTSSMQIQFDHEIMDEDSVIYGYTVDPVHPVGRR
jgi:hypothetical protein